MSLVYRPIFFDGVDLNSVTGVTILESDPYKPPKRTVSTFNLARIDKSKTNAAYYSDKTINVKVGITATTREIAEKNYESLIALLQGIEKDLLVPESGALRRYTATLFDIIFTTSGGAYLEFTLVFKLSDNFGYDINFTPLLQASGRTLYNYTDPITLTGSANFQAPIIKVTLTALTGGTTKDLTIKNPGTLQALTVNRTWAAGDVLIIDSQNQTVKVNGVDVDFSGNFPYWARGVGYLQYTDGFLTRTMTIFAYYFVRNI